MRDKTPGHRERTDFDAIHIAVPDDGSPLASVSALAEVGCAVSYFDPHDLSAWRKLESQAVIASRDSEHYNPLEVFREIRARDLACACILLSERFVPDDVEQVFRAGGDDYLLAPLGTAQLMVRLKVSLLRRMAIPPPQAEVTVGPLRIDAFQRVFIRGGAPGELPNLPKKELQVLRYLSQHAGRVVTHEQLRATGWCTVRPLGSNSLEVHVSRIRRWLRAALPDGSLEIASLRGVGYMLTLVPDQPSHVRGGSLG